MTYILLSVLKLVVSVYVIAPYPLPLVQSTFTLPFSQVADIVMNPFMEHADTPAPPEMDTTAAHARPPDDEGVTCISIDDIARKLLRENFYLTALELHCELCELGAELPRLRNFFSNPGNFERQMPFKPELAGQLSSTNLRKSHCESSFVQGAGAEGDSRFVRSGLWSRPLWLFFLEKTWYRHRRIYFRRGSAEAPCFPASCIVCPQSPVKGRHLHIYFTAHLQTAAPLGKLCCATS